MPGNFGALTQSRHVGKNLISLVTNDQIDRLDPEPLQILKVPFEQSPPAKFQQTFGEVPGVFFRQTAAPTGGQNDCAHRLSF